MTVSGAVVSRPYNDAQARADIRQAFAEHLPTIQAFHELVYRQKYTWSTTRFEGVPILKLPQDLWTYHEWIHLLKPTLILETGTAKGGSALYFARQMAAWDGCVWTVDVEAHERPESDAIIYWHGSSVDPVAIASAEALAAFSPRVMVVLDSCHETDHVLAELDAYAKLVSRGQLLVVEDTNTPGPAEALKQWLPRHPEFQPEILCERHLLSFSPSGWLRRVA